MIPSHKSSLDIFLSRRRPSIYKPNSLDSFSIIHFLFDRVIYELSLKHLLYYNHGKELMKMKKIIVVIITLGFIVAGSRFSPVLASGDGYGDVEPAYPAIPAEIQH